LKIKAKRRKKERTVIKFENDGHKNHSIFFPCYSISSTPALNETAGNGRFSKIIDQKFSGTVKPRFLIQKFSFGIYIITNFKMGKYTFFQ